MAKIAIELERALTHRARCGGPGIATGRLLASGDGWTVEDVVCTSGPDDRAFEERHADVSIAIVAAGTFQYRSTAGEELMTPGSVLLGSPGQTFECGHEHGAGDRCVSFHYSPAYFERIAFDAGARAGRCAFGALRLPPMRALSPLVARACAGIVAATAVSWEELGVHLAARATQLTGLLSADAPATPPNALARVTRAVRHIAERPHESHGLGQLARRAGLSSFHFLRVFEQLTGATPHQFLLRTRLRDAALRLATGGASILDVAFDSGFGDVSNFNRSFRQEFGASPRTFRASQGRSLRGKITFSPRDAQHPPSG